MRNGKVVLGLVTVLVLIAVFINYRFDWPVRLLNPPPAAMAAQTPAQGNGSTYVARYSNDRGLQDAPRNDIPQGEEIDSQRCLNTMALRGLKPAVAEHTCKELIDGISRLR